MIGPSSCDLVDYNSILQKPSLFDSFRKGIEKNELAVPLAWIFAVAMLLNGLGHIGIMFVRRQYFPGGITAFLLLLVAAYLMLHLKSR